MSNDNTVIDIQNVVDSSSIVHKEDENSVPSADKDPAHYSMSVWDETQKKFIKQMIDRGKCYIYLYDKQNIEYLYYLRDYYMYHLNIIYIV